MSDHDSFDPLTVLGRTGTGSWRLRSQSTRSWGRVCSRPRTKSASRASSSCVGSTSSRQVALPVAYKGVTVEAAYRIDLLVEGRVVIEVKSVERLARIHLAQLLTYLRLAKLPVGILLDFNEERLRDGIRRLGNTNR